MFSFHLRCCLKTCQRNINAKWNVNNNNNSDKEAFTQKVDLIPYHNKSSQQLIFESFPPGNSHLNLFFIEFGLPSRRKICCFQKSYLKKHSHSCDAVAIIGRTWEVIKMQLNRHHLCFSILTIFKTSIHTWKSWNLFLELLLKSRRRVFNFSPKFLFSR